MFDLLKGLIGALIISLIPISIAALAEWLERREERRRRDPSVSVLLDRLENVILDRLTGRK